MNRLLAAAGVTLASVVVLNIALFAARSSTGVPNPTIPFATQNHFGPGPGAAGELGRIGAPPVAPAQPAADPLSDYNAVTNANGDIVRIYRRDPNDMVVGVIGSNGNDMPMSGYDSPARRELIQRIAGEASAAARR